MCVWGAAEVGAAHPWGMNSLAMVKAPLAMSESGHKRSSPAPRGNVHIAIQKRTFHIAGIGLSERFIFLCPVEC
jgi:hypothetical protein